MLPMMKSQTWVALTPAPLMICPVPPLLKVSLVKLRPVWDTLDHVVAFVEVINKTVPPFKEPIAKNLALLDVPPKFTDAHVPEALETPVQVMPSLE